MYTNSTFFGKKAKQNTQTPFFWQYCIILRQYRIILSADTASEVRQLLAKSADNTLCIIEHFGNADAVPQPPERCLSRQARIVRCCPKRRSAA